MLFVIICGLLLELPLLPRFLMRIKIWGIEIW